MLSREDNELLTNTDQGTPMGELFRRFWLPVALSEELPGPDCVPVRVKILDEDLIAFRDTDGRVGLVDAYCPHRGAPMFFGRNEEDGLRCVYHGWKFDVDGECVDLPNAPEGDTFRNKIHIKSLPLRRGRRHGLGLHGPEGQAAAVPGVRLDEAAGRRTATSPSSASSATGCRPRRATSTPRTAASCTAPSTTTRQPATALCAPAHQAAASRSLAGPCRRRRALPVRRRQPPRHAGRRRAEASIEDIDAGALVIA